MREKKVLYNAVVCYLLRGDEFLMAMKTQKISKGCWNGYGGGIEVGESPRIATVREVWEETRYNVLISLARLEKVAEIDFHNHTEEGIVFTCRVHFFFSRCWVGRPTKTKEMITPTFFTKNNIPFDKLMPADKIFLPILLRGDKIIAEFCYCSFQKELIGFPKIKFVDSFNDE